MTRQASIFILLFLQLFISDSFAGERTKEEMRMAALHALSTKNKSRGVSAKTSDLKEYISKEKLSVFGSENLGFAVVTSDDRFDEVIGYSLSNFSDAMPCGFKWWLESANNAMEKAKGLVPAKTRGSGTIKSGGVSPLVTTKWGQEKPYNNQCKNTIDGKEYYLLTGCGATAMAQIMNYYKYPTKGKGENSYIINYTDWGKQTYYANFENSYYDWDNMLDDYSDYYYTKPEDKYTDAVSKLMSDCGKAVNMIYRTWASTAFTYRIPIGFKNYFSYSFYDENKTIYNRSDFPNNDDWMNLIYNALNNNCPIFYRGDNKGEDGHFFVIHGYEPDGKVIVNWGWNGRYDGSFMIDILTPGYNTFNDNQQMIIPIPKNKTVDINYTLTYIVDGVLYREYKKKSGETITPESAPTKEGYTFSGWSSIPKTMPAKDVTVSGSFSKGSYKLTYMVDGSVYKTVNYNYGNAIISEPVPTKDGYTFSGWSGVPQTMPANNVTVSGSFTINKYILTYQIDGEVYKNYEVEYGATIPPESAPIKDGYSFSGWSSIPSTMPNHNLTITGEFINNKQSANTVIAEINGIYYILVGSSRTAEVKKSPNKYSGDITIPETVEYEGFTYQVTQIGENAFSGCYNMSSIKIPSSIAKIGNNAFADCNKLSSIVLPNSVLDIGESAFVRCKGLSSVTLPDGIKIIKSSTFLACSALKSIIIPNSVTSLEDGVFYGCSALESVLLSTNLTSMGTACFYGCENLSSIVIPEKVTNIAYQTFYGCTNLKTIKIGGSVKTVGEKAFAECKALESVICMAENPPTASSNVFENSYIEYLTLYVPDASVNSYQSASPWNKFETIKGMSDYNPNEQHAPSKIVEINGVCYILIGKSRTAEVTKSQIKYSGDITIPETVEYEGFTYQVTQIGENAFGGCYNLSSIKIPSSITRIGNYAFQDCNKLSSIVLPNSIQYIGEHAFLRCKGLSSVTLPDGITIIKSSTFLACSALKSIIIPNSVTSLDDGVFYGCSALESVLLSTNLTSMGTACFYGCENLSSIVIPEKVTNIAYQTFYGCTNLKIIKIGGSVKTVGEKAFAECKALESVICMAENPPTASSNVFENSYVVHATLYVSDASVNSYQSVSPWNQFDTIKRLSEYNPDEHHALSQSAEINGICYILIGKSRTAEVTKSQIKYSGDITIPETVEYEGFTYQVTQIGDNAFGGCYNLSSIKIPSSITRIGNYAFQDCNKLSSIVLPNSIQYIGKHAFLRCKGLSSVTLPDGITIIKSSTFLACSALKSIIIPNSVTSLDDGVFYGCSALESVLLSMNLTSMGTACFYGCENLSSIVIPEKVTNIAYQTFYGCTNLKTIKIGGSVKTVGEKSFAECKALDSVICMAENPPTASSYAFENSYIEHVTLYVPDNSVNKYRSQEPWSKFGQVVIRKWIAGDANSNGVVDDADIAEVVAYLMGNPSINFDKDAADANKDGIVNAADIVKIVNIIYKPN